jgi:hypothetical protein
VVPAAVVKQKDMDYQTILSTLRSRDINDRILMVYMMQDNAIFRDLNREQLKVIAHDICVLCMNYDSITHNMLPYTRQHYTFLGSIPPIAYKTSTVAGMPTKYIFYFNKDNRYKRKSYYSIIQELTAQIIHKLSDK